MTNPSPLRILARNGRRARWRRRLPWARATWDRGLFEGLDWPGGRRAAVALTFDLDYQEDEAALPSVLAALAAAGAPASFACIGAWVQARPAAYQPLAQGRWEIVNHSQNHPFHELIDASRSWDTLSEEEALAEIRAGHETLARALAPAAPPRVFRAPHFAWSHATHAALARAGYRASSSGFYAEEPPFGSLPFVAGAVLEIPLQRRLGTYLTLRKGGETEAAFLTRFHHALDRERARGGLAVFCFDPRDFAGREALLAEVVRAATAPDLWPATLGAIADHLLGSGVGG